MWKESGRVFNQILVINLECKINVLRIASRIVSYLPVFWKWKKRVDPGAFVRWFIHDSVSISVY